MLAKQAIEQPIEPFALKAREAAVLTRISERVLYSLTSEGEIPCVRIGRAVLYRPESLKKWLKEREAKGVASDNAKEL